MFNTQSWKVARLEVAQDPPSVTVGCGLNGVFCVNSMLNCEGMFVLSSSAIQSFGSVSLMRHELLQGIALCSIASMESVDSQLCTLDVFEYNYNANQMAESVMEGQ